MKEERSGRKICGKSGSEIACLPLANGREMKTNRKATKKRDKTRKLAGKDEGKAMVKGDR